MKRLQGEAYHSVKDKLIPIEYSVTTNGNICVYYKKGLKHYLNDEEKLNFKPDGLKERK